MDQENKMTITLEKYEEMQETIRNLEKELEESKNEDFVYIDYQEYPHGSHHPQNRSVGIRKKDVFFQDLVSAVSKANEKAIIDFNNSIHGISNEIRSIESVLGLSSNRSSYSTDRTKLHVEFSQVVNSMRAINDENSDMSTRIAKAKKSLND